MILRIVRIKVLKKLIELKTNNRKYITLLISVLFLSFLSAYTQENRPDKPEIIVVSIDSSTNETIIKWNPSKSGNIQSYNIYQVDTTTFPVTGKLIGNVPGDSLSFTDQSSDHENVYSITALSTGNESLLGGDYHKPAILSVKYDSCNASMQLKWKPYIGWDNSIAGYRIFQKMENEDFEQIYENNPSTTEISIQNIDENTHYEFVVETFNNMNIKSTSNRVKYYTYMPLPPEYVNIDQVSVMDNTTIELTISADISSEINDFQLTRAASPTANFSPVTRITDLDKITTVLYDEGPTAIKEYYYRVEALNSCSLPVAYSNIANSLLLTDSLYKENNNTIVKLEWNEYNGFYGDLYGYELYRITKSGKHLPVDTLKGNTQFSENLASLEYDYLNGSPVEGELTYYVQAIEANNNQTGYRGTCKSNELKVQVETIIVTPNAFNPGPTAVDDNKTFAPILNFRPKNYQMLIFDRSGMLLFRTNEPSEGWDGSIEGGGKASEGVYVYHIQYESYNGASNSKIGNLTLIRQ